MAHSCTGSDASFADPAVRIMDWVSAFGANGLFLPVCADRLRSRGPAPRRAPQPVIRRTFDRIRRRARHFRAMRSPWKVGVGLFSVIALAAGCGGHSLSPDGGGGHGGTTGTGTAGTMGGGGSGGTGGTGGKFTPTRDVDILFMIDNSSSTSLIQANLTANFPTFMTALRNQPGGLPNLHVAIINSDMGAGDGSIAGCDSTGGRPGRLPVHAARQLHHQPPHAEPDVHHRHRRQQELHGQPRGRVHLPRQTGRDRVRLRTAARLGRCARSAPTAGDGSGREPHLPARERAAVHRHRDQRGRLLGPDRAAACSSTASTTLASALGPVQNFRCNEFGHLCNGVKPPRMAPSGRRDRHGAARPAAAGRGERHADAGGDLRVAAAGAEGVSGRPES